MVYVHLDYNYHHQVLTISGSPDKADSIDIATDL